MPSRRDVLRILLLGSGALYLAPGLGSCTQTKQQSVHRASRHSPGVEHQRFEIAHRYIRDHQTNTLDWQATRSSSIDVAIVGAGPAGLTAAALLRTAGYDVALIENEPVGGGAARAGTYNDVRYPLAAIYFVEREGIVADLCRLAGVTPIPVPEDSLILDGASFANLWDDATITSLPIKPTEKTSLRCFRDDLLRLRQQEQVPEYPLPEELPPHWRRLDAMDAATYIAGYQSPLLRSLLDMYTRSSMGGMLEQVNAYALLNFYASEIGTQRYTFAGGLAGLAAPLAAMLGSALHTGLTCIRISDDRTGANVWAIDRDGGLHRFHARAVIVATQKFMLPWIIPELPAAQQAAMRSLQYAPFLTVHLCGKETLLPPGFDVWVPGGDKLFTDIINANATSAPPSNNGVVASIYAPRTSADRAILQSEDVLAAFARTIAERATHVLPTINADAVEEVHVFGWGHALVVPTPGSHSGLAQAARRPFGHILFANTDNDSSPAFENAVSHGARAAESAIALLKQ
ncbi:MAG: hypothetical protein KatS3mg039_1150 [Candidatus Kapaibacterium sp.]|nr:MAG: hypothetical protein KatS3mg039_1150 [Candidatus Kapabacteria bacterium]